jgi:hypothetical protein
MSVPISSINLIKVGIDDERDFKILEGFSNRAKRVWVVSRCLEIQEIYDPNLRSVTESLDVKLFKLKTSNGMI